MKEQFIVVMLIRPEKENGYTHNSYGPFDSFIKASKWVIKNYGDYPQLKWYVAKHYTSI